MQGVNLMREFWLSPAMRHPCFPEALLVAEVQAGFSGDVQRHATSAPSVFEESFAYFSSHASLALLVCLLLVWGATWAVALPLVAAEVRKFLPPLQVAAAHATSQGRRVASVCLSLCLRPGLSQQTPSLRSWGGEGLLLGSLCSRATFSRASLRVPRTAWSVGSGGCRSSAFFEERSRRAEGRAWGCEFPQLRFSSFPVWPSCQSRSSPSASVKLRGRPWTQRPKRPQTEFSKEKCRDVGGQSGPPAVEVQQKAEGECLCQFFQ